MRAPDVYATLNESPKRTGYDGILNDTSTLVTCNFAWKKDTDEEKLANPPLDETIQRHF